MSGGKKLAMFFQAALLTISLVLSNTNNGNINAKNYDLLDDTEFAMIAENQDFGGRRLGACSITDGSANTTSSCDCGQSTCSSGSFCNLETNECLSAAKAGCVQSGGVVKNTVTCSCGNVTSCNTTYYCDSSKNSCTTAETSIENIVPTAANSVGVIATVNISTTASNTELTNVANLLEKIFDLSDITSEVMNVATNKMSAVFAGLSTSTATANEKTALKVKILAVLEKAATASVSLVSFDTPSQTVSTPIFDISTFLNTYQQRRLAITIQNSGDWSALVPNSSIFHTVVLNILGYKTLSQGIKIQEPTLNNPTILSDGLRLYLQKNGTIFDSWTGNITSEYIEIGYEWTSTNAFNTTLEADIAKQANKEIKCIHTSSLSTLAYSQDGTTLDITKVGNKYKAVCKSTVYNKYFFIARIPQVAPIASSPAETTSPSAVTTTSPSAVTTHQAGSSSQSSGAEKLVLGVMIAAMLY